MDNSSQPNQPTGFPQPQSQPQEQLLIAPTPPPQAQETPPQNPKKKNLALIILASVLGLIIILAVVLVIIFSIDTKKPSNDSDQNNNSNNNNSSNNENNSNSNNANNNSSNSEKNNLQRKDDLDRFLTSVTDFASNNSGRLPFTIDNTGAGTENPNFVARYIDSSCTGGPSTSNTFECTANYFRDPDGSIYHFAIIDGSSLNTGDRVPDITTNFEQSNHAIYTVIGAACGVDEGTVTAGTVNRQVALFMVLDDNSITCRDNI